MKSSAGADRCCDVDAVVPEVLDQDLQHSAVPVLGRHMEGGEAGRVPLGQTRAVVNQHPGSLLVPTLSLGKIRTSGLGSDTFRSRERQISLFSTLRDSICESDSRTCQQGCINIVLLPSDNEMSPTISDCQ